MGWVGPTIWARPSQVRLGQKWPNKPGIYFLCAGLDLAQPSRLGLAYARVVAGLTEQPC
jgi:hypothetical protein